MTIQTVYEFFGADLYIDAEFDKEGELLYMLISCDGVQLPESLVDAFCEGTGIVAKVYKAYDFEIERRKEEDAADREFNRRDNEILKMEGRL